jgi:hypothetical protein
MNFDVFSKKTLCLAKMAITFAYEVGLKSFLYKKSIRTKSYIRIQQPTVVLTMDGEEAG